MIIHNQMINPQLLSPTFRLLFKGTINLFIIFQYTYKLQTYNFENHPILMFQPNLNSHSLNLPTVHCAFHHNHLVSNFCHYSQCLLPLCKECLPIHRREHSTIPEPMLLSTVDQAVAQLITDLQAQSLKIQQFHRIMLAKFDHTDQGHKNIKLRLIEERDSLVRMIMDAYEGYFFELSSNFEKRQEWLVEFERNMEGMRLQLQGVYQSVFSEKYLRTIIMWNRQKPGEVVNEMLGKTVREWDEASIDDIDLRKVNINDMICKRGLKMLEIQGDFGLNKLCRVLRTVKLGQDGYKNKCVGIQITDQKKRRQRQKQKEPKITVYSSQVKSC